MSKINLLNDQLVNLIAAGEVVERPSGVVKELVENSIDAKSEKIIIKIEDGGLKKISVFDDGEGMDPIDASNCLQRHATSKIAKNNDLWNIKTMGFRGEALPSIGAVSKMRIVTNDGTLGTEIKTEYGKIISAQPIAAPRGTSVEVEDLFYKTPARLKHMKSAQREGIIISGLVERLALANPGIAFELYSNDVLRLSTKGNNNIKQLYFDLFGSETAKNLLVDHVENYDFKVDLELIFPHISRNNKQNIQVFINNRLVDDYYLQRAIVSAYSEFLPKDRYPIATVRVTCDFNMVDVNVHPSKQEVRISGQLELCSLIENKVRDSLSKNMTTKQISTPKIIDESKVKGLENNTFDNIYKEDIRPNEQLKLDGFDLNDELSIGESNENDRGIEELKNLSIIGQLLGDYIICNNEESLYIIDQHAAQERVNFEQICNEIKQNDIQKQPLLIPEIIELTPKNKAQIEVISDTLNSIGFEFEELGDNTIVCREIPLWMAKYDIKSIFIDVLNNLDEYGRTTKQEEAERKILATIACHKSIKFNHRLERVEMERLVKDLSNCMQPYNCPHGRPTILKYSIQGFRKEFGRE